MKKAYLVLSSFLLLLTFSVPAYAAEQTFEGSGEVLSVDAMYSRITIKHGAIPGFAGGPETEFFVASSELLKNINKRDLVEFTIVEKSGDAKIEKINKTGVAPETPDPGLPVGQAVQGVLVATGEAAKAVTSPVTPAHEVISGAVGATTDTTGSVLNDSDGTKLKTKF